MSASSRKAIRSKQGFYLSRALREASQENCRHPRPTIRLRYRRSRLPCPDSAPRLRAPSLRSVWPDAASQSCDCHLPPSLKRDRLGWPPSPSGGGEWRIETSETLAILVDRTGMAKGKRQRVWQLRCREELPRSGNRILTIVPTTCSPATGRNSVRLRNANRHYVRRSDEHRVTLTHVESRQEQTRWSIRRAGFLATVPAPCKGASL